MLYKVYGFHCSISLHKFMMSSTRKKWVRIIHQEEEEDDDEYFFGDDEENMIMGQYLVSQEASGSHRRYAHDALPRWPNKRDHAAGDAMIRADYFAADPVFSPMHFRRRYV
jgi:hypothetical protein